MGNEIIILSTTAFLIGFIHTILGPDHYLPFVVLAKVRKWSIAKLSVVTFLCGIGHIASSIILGFIGIILGISIFKLEIIESSRAELSAWFLIIFGFMYFIWGIRRALRKQPHEHIHYHEEGQEHLHTHNHFKEHSHVHSLKRDNLSPWILFIIFVFGPCEPLIPLIMYPAAKHNMLAVSTVSFIFGVTTILTMMFIVLFLFYGILKLPTLKFEKYSHALAGFTIFICGSTIKFFGL